MSNVFREQELPIYELLHDKGCRNINYYILVENSGYTFTYKKVKYDLRFWRNMYGIPLMMWDVMALGKGADKEFMSELNQQANKIGATAE